MRKILFLFIFLIAFTPVYARKIEISFWHSLGFHIKALVEEMAQEYSKENSEVIINPVFQGLFDEMQVKMLAAAVTRQLPDVAQVQVEYLDPYIENGIIEPIEKSIPQELFNDIPSQLWDLVRRDDSIYAVPFAISTTVFFYNPDAFRRAGLDPDSPPLTWDDMIRIGKRLTRDTNGDGEVDSYAMMFWANGLYGIMPFFWANGGEFFSQDGSRVEMTSPAMQKTIKMLMDLIFTYKIMPRTWTDWEGGQAFLTGKLAMGAFTSAGISYGEQNLPWPLRVSPMPSVNGKRYTVLGGSALVNFSSSRKKREYVNDFIAWCVNDENTTRLHEKTGYVPVRKSALNSLELKAFHRENPNYLVPIESLKYARPLPHHPEFYKMNELIRDMLHRLILDESDITTELERVEKEINALMG
jgi:ABC-type glycerol-3-phosphate transport system substrate-binding protein